MKTTVSGTDRHFYAENGYLVMEEFLSASELEQWRGAVDEAIQQRGADVSRHRRLVIARSA